MVFFDYYFCVVSFFCWLGKFKEVYDFIKVMFVEFYVSVWGLVLGGCSVYGDFEIVEVVVRWFFKFEL